MKMKNRLLIVAALIVAATTLIFSYAKARVASYANTQGGQVNGVGCHRL